MTRKIVLVPLASGAEEVEATTIFDVLDRCEITPLLLAVAPEKEVRLAHGLVIQTPSTISEWINSKHDGDVKKFAASLDAVLLPGGMPGATHLRESNEVVQTLKELSQSKKLVGAVCASPAVVLASLGIVNSDTHATCFPGMKERFCEHSVKWIDAPVVYNKATNVLTSQGPGTTAGFALAASALLNGAEVAEKVNKAMLTHWSDSIQAVMQA